MFSDVRLGQPQQGSVPAEPHRYRRGLPACCGAADTAQPLCHELHGNDTQLKVPVFTVLHPRYIQMYVHKQIDSVITVILHILYIMLPSPILDNGKEVR